jgi:trimeric autotransporter adhesin
MSTKTIKHRIAIVAVSALTAGLFSVVSAPVANAAAGDITAPTNGALSTKVITPLALAGTTSGTARIAVDGTFGFNTVAGTGVVHVDITGGTFTSPGTSAGSTNTSTLLITASATTIVNAVATPSGVGNMVIRSFDGSVATGTLRTTVTVAVTDERPIGDLSGQIHISGSICGVTNLVGTTPLSARAGTSTDISPFESGSAAGRVVTVPLGGLLTINYDASDVVTLSGPLSIQSLDPAGTGAAAASITNGKVVVTGRAADDSFTLNASAVGTATLVVDASTADATPTAANTIRVTIVAACASSSFVAAASFVSVEDSSITATDNVDLSASQADAEQGFLSIVANNQFGTVVPSGTWIVSATNGARVAITANASAAAATTTGPSQAFATGAGTDVRVAVAQATEGVAQTSVVTVTYNGALVATRSFSWTGDLASITVSSVRLGNTGAANYNSFVVRTFDAAGNQIAWPNASLTLEGFDQNVTTGDAVATATASAEGAATNDGNFFTCGSGAKAVTKLKVKGINGSLASIFSPEFNASCSTSTRTFTASLDKAVYVPGDIATLTLTAKDVNGNAPFDPTSTDANDSNETFNYVNAGVAGTAQAFGYSNLTPVVGPAAGDFYLGGVKTYQFVVGATEGDYQFTVGIAGLTNDTAKTVKYSIKSTSTATSNADVLKAIVSLIASINKQIAALQKALLRR